MSTSSSTSAAAVAAKPKPSAKTEAEAALLIHPLTPLTETELELANELVRESLKNVLEAKYSENAISFIETSLFEPLNKHEVLLHEDPELWWDFDQKQLDSSHAFHPYASNIRIAEVVCFISSTRESVVALVELLPKQRLRSIDISHGKIQPAFSVEEYAIGGEIVREYEPFRELCRQRGLDVNKVKVDSWAPGYFGEEDHPRRRLAWPLIYYQEHELDNIYGRPLEGLEILVDLNSREVLKFEVIESKRDILLSLISKDPKMYYSNLDDVKDKDFLDYESETDNYMEPDYDMKPLDIVQPEGPSFVVGETDYDGNKVSWLNWDFRIGFTPKEGVVLHLVTFLGRPVLYRASFAEMVVPYGDPNYPHYKKNAFDAGEDGLGRNAHSLTLSCDCKGCIYYFDAVVTDTDGSADVIQNAICLHEEDDGIAWKHKNWRTEKSEVRRKRKLVVSFICTVANYEYGFYYHLFQDGTIEFCVKLTGIVSTGIVKTSQVPKYGTVIFKDERTQLGLYAPAHQHFFCAKMDFAIDGLRNKIVEVNVERETDMSKNVRFNAFYPTFRTLQTELEAMRDVNTASARHWLVQSEDTLNRVDELTAYKIIPNDATKPFAMPEAMFLRRASFLNHHLYVTKHNPNKPQRFPGGDFPNQNPNVGDGILTYNKENKSIVNQDLVVWYVFGITHVVRLEDWPVMPVVELTFKIEPFGFCDASPVVHLPAPVSGGDKSEDFSKEDDEEECENCKAKTTDAKGSHVSKL